MKKRTTIYHNDILDKKLKPYIEKYKGITKTFTIITDRYSEIIKIDSQAVCEIFSENEIKFMLKNIFLLDFQLAKKIKKIVIASVKNEILENFIFFDVDKDVLIKKLKTLTTGQLFALVDMLENLSNKK